MTNAEKKIYEILAFTDPDPTWDREKGYLADMTGRSGREILSYLDEVNDIAIYIDTLEELSEEEKEAEIY
jgi:hypothetical protein